jgi:hypothetical protein
MLSNAFLLSNHLIQKYTEFGHPVSAGSKMCHRYTKCFTLVLQGCKGLQ